ncbi:MAG: choice-of-anchor Q domain-containing protein [Pirellulales bacterium]
MSPNTLTETTITGNSASDSGGAIYSRTDDGSTTIISSTISDNSATLAGGGILSFTENDGTMIIRNTTISGNSARLGGGWNVTGGSSTISHSTVTANTASEYGGGIHINTGTTTIGHTLVSGNTATLGGSEIRRETGTVNLNDYNLFGDSSNNTAQALLDVTAGATDITAASDGSNPTPLSAILETTLANNGGPTHTHALVIGSPALDAGDPIAVAGVGDVPLYDQRGTPFGRVNDHLSGGTRIDIGAYEFLSADLNFDGFVDSLDLGILLGNFNTSVPHSGGELNGTDPVNSLDLGILLGAWAPPTLVTASEPAAANLLSASAATETVQSQLLMTTVSSTAFSTNVWLMLPGIGNDIRPRALVDDSSLPNQVSTEQIDSVFDKLPSATSLTVSHVESLTLEQTDKFENDPPAVDEVFEEWDHLALVPEWAVPE